MLYAFILLNLVAGVVIFALPTEWKKAPRRIALAAATVSLVLSVIVFALYDREAGGYQLQDSFAWLPSIGVSLHVGVDGISSPMVLLTGIVIFTGVLVSWRIDERPREYFALLLLLVAGTFGVFVVLDLFSLFFFYEVAVLPMFLLIGVWGSTRKAYSSMKLVMVLLAGSILIWVAMLVLYFNAGIGSFDILELEQAGVDTTVARVLFPILYVGFGVLAGMWPFHTWSPDGHVAAPTAVSMLHAGVLMKLGAYGIIRVGIQLLPEGATYWLGVFLTLAVVNVVYGAFSAMAQRDLKFVIGYSSVSHMGYVLMGIGSMTVVGMNGAVLQMFSHGVMTALFFAMVGVVYERAHTREISAFSGMAKVMPRFSIIFIIAGLASLGLPGLSGFAAEFLVFAGTFQAAPWLAVLGIIGVAITATYILRLVAGMFFGPVTEKWRNLTDANLRETAVGVMLVAMLLLFGLYPQLMVGSIDVSAIPLLANVGG